MTIISGIFPKMTGTTGKGVFENYEKFYTKFVRPPLAKIYHPTSEEFADPIAYIAQIKPEAEKYGVVKIVPPDDFKPSFAIDKSKFAFTPRIQKLCEIEAFAREKNAFVERITQYWELQGTEYRQPILEGRPIDLFKAHLLIRSEGGVESVTENKRWTAVAKVLGLTSNKAGYKLKDHYTKIVLPFVDTIETKEVEPKKEEEEEEMKDDLNRGLGEGRSIKSDEKDSKILCSVCNRDDNNDKLVNCTNCTTSIHLTCMKTSMKARPKKGWHCPSCVESQVRGMGVEDGFEDSTTSYTLDTFGIFANEYKRQKFGKEPSQVPLDDIEKLYWRNMLDGEMDLEVKYGADLMVSKVGSGFHRRTDANLTERDQEMANHPWNLNNMPVGRDSVLSHMDESISGMTVPWVYVGMVFSTFCWHTEDHWTYSVNYNHWGEPKIWYGIGGDQAAKFEEVIESICPSLFRIHPDLLHHMTVAANPHLLRSRGVDVHTVHQNPGEFVITFPRAYHAGFNQGLNFAEAVNFAPVDWLSHGRDAMLSYAKVQRNCVFAHDELVMNIARSSGNLSSSIAAATLEELRIINLRERENREEAERRGVTRRERLTFESIQEDDERMCGHCNTTLFMSAVRCSHGKNACLDHIDHLCEKSPSNTTRHGRSIIGGSTVTTPGRWPWQLLLFGEHFCGATVISEQWVLTAAHCFSSGNVSEKKIQSGVTRYNFRHHEFSNDTILTAIELSIHPKYNESASIDDIALLKLDRPIIFNHLVSPICLPTPSQSIPDDSQAVVTGFGRSNVPGTYNLTYDGKLREVIVPIRTKDVCEEGWTDEEKGRKVICASSLAHGAHQGDSGGPLIMKASDGRWFQLGIAAFIQSMEVGIDDKNPNAFTDVRQYCDWIKETTGGEAACQEKEVTLEDVEIKA